MILLNEDDKIKEFDFLNMKFVFLEFDIKIIIEEDIEEFDKYD